jgi:hypothetical protein
LKQAIILIKFGGNLSFFVFEKFLGHFFKRREVFIDVGDV